MLRPEQRKLRLTGVTASEIAAVVGVCPWKSRQEVWEEKVTGISPELDSEDIERGNELETAIVQWTAKREGLSAHSYGDLQITHNRCNGDVVCLATPDAMWQKEDRESFADPYMGPMEVKSPSWRTASDWTDTSIPDNYYLQVQWQLGVIGHPLGLVGALVGGRLLTYWIEAHQALFEELVRRAAEFWRYVKRNEIPPILPNDKHVNRWLDNYYQRSNGDLIEVTDREEDHHFYHLALDYQEAKRHESEAKKRKENVAAQFKEAIGELDGLKGGQWKVTWKTAKDGKRRMYVKTKEES